MSAALVVAALWAAFIASHLALSHPPVRASLVARLGENAFAGVYSLVAFALIVPMSWVWWTNRHTGPLWWNLRGVAAVTHTAELLVLLGFALTFGGLARPAPSARGVRPRGEVRGMAAVTRHPVFMGFSLWAVAHLLVNGWATDVVYFAGYPVMTVVGGWHQDWRKARESEAYREVLAATSFVPFGRPGNLPNVGARAAIGAAVGVAVAIVLRVWHTSLFGG